jgi:RNA polymerase sigma factor (sigma-70 family)
MRGRDLEWPGAAALRRPQKGEHYKKNRRDNLLHFGTNREEARRRFVGYYVYQQGRNDVLRQYLTRIAGGQSSDLTDAELLDRFVRRRDEAAFTALMQRHGGMVMGVCRRILRQAQDVEDACQATFMVLARKAKSIRRGDSLSCWLHGVAYRISLRLKADAARRTEQRRDTASLVQPEPETAVTWQEAMQVLDEELARLPKHLRATLVLCYLEGRTQDEAARRLGWTLGAFRGRLERAREKLRARLVRRGVTLPTVLFGAGLGSAALEAMPSALLAATSKSAASVATGVAARSVVSAKVAALSEGMVNNMVLTKFKIVVAFLFVALAVAGAAACFLPARNQATEVVLAAARSVQAQEDKSFQKLKLDADDLAEVTGVNIYKFQVNIPKGQRFRVVLREVKEKDAEPHVLHQYSFLKETADPLVIQVAFLRRDQKLAGALLSGEKDAEYRVVCAGCSPSGIVTIVPIPLADVPPTRKTLFVLQSDKQAQQIGLKGMQLITLVASEPGKPAPPPTSAPRAEWVIEPE